MVKVKDNESYLSKGSLDIDQWLQQLAAKGYSDYIDPIRHACSLSQLTSHHATETGQSCLEQGLAMADILADLEVPYDTLIAAIIFVNVYYAEITIEDVIEQLGQPIAKLVRGVLKMSAISNWQALEKTPQAKHQIDTMRRMLLAMVDDVRVVLIKLAERLSVLRSLSPLPSEVSQPIAREAMDIYAPLANRLSLGAIKWEMEDLAFRYLHPCEYKAIAKGLKSKRLERDRYVNLIVDELNQHLKALGLTHFAVYGRSKHIHSIYRKMVRKNVPLDEIYDATAVRILVDTKEQCYEVLGLVHSIWRQVTAEFDDYIINVKPNGYQSLHTAVIGPEEKVFEVQIRTFQMHDQAEMGVAAHWKYKEGGVLTKESHTRKIEWLREVFAWQREMARNQGVAEQIEAEFLEDRVYVFTPDGQVLDLQQGSTPIDFAYHLHSQLGHRCRGAKVNGHIVPLTYLLKTGDRVEVLTGKEEKPSRDWINPHLNYLKTSRAKAKVLHWFKMQDYEKNKVEGQEILEKEIKALGLKPTQLNDVAIDLQFKKTEDMLAALGRGDVKLNQILNRLLPTEHGIKKEAVVKTHPEPTLTGSDLQIQGTGRLLTHLARCCQPVPGDEVIGYVTLGRGVSIHKLDCSNILHASESQKKRFLEVNWGQVTKEHYLVDLLIKAYDRTSLLRDITGLFANEKAHVYSLKTESNHQDNVTQVFAKVEIDGLESLSRLITKLNQIPNVFETRRIVG